MSPKTLAWTIRGAGGLTIGVAIFVAQSNFRYLRLPLKLAGNMIEVPFDIPLAIVLGALGICALVSPAFGLSVLGVTLPSPVAKPLWNAANSIRRAYASPPVTPPDDLQGRIAEFQEAVNKRYYRTVTLLVLGLLLIVGCVIWAAPKMVDVYVSARERTSTDDAYMLCRLLQDKSLAIGSSDSFAPHVISIGQSIQDKQADDKATFELWRMLNALFVASSSDPEFRGAVDGAYASALYDNQHSTGLLHIDRVLAQVQPAPNTASLFAYFTLLGVICNLKGQEQGDIRYFLQAQQLLAKAIDLCGGQAENAVGAHNGLGIALVETLRRYSDYELFFMCKPQDFEFIRDALGIKAAASRISLAVAAEAHYQVGVTSGRTKFVRARAINNQVDLWLEVLHERCVNQVAFPSSNPEEARFAHDRLAENAPEALPARFGDMESLLVSARRLGGGASTAVTLAQLYAVAGAIADTQANPRVPKWGDGKFLARACYEHLVAARRMDMPEAIFAPEAARELHLEWMWRQPEYTDELKGLAQH